jgi:hypothetical protein
MPRRQSILANRIAICKRINRIAEPHDGFLGLLESQ